MRILASAEAVESLWGCCPDELAPGQLLRTGNMSQQPYLDSNRTGFRTAAQHESLSSPHLNLQFSSLKVSPHHSNKGQLATCSVVLLSMHFPRFKCVYKATCHALCCGARTC